MIVANYYWLDYMDAQWGCQVEEPLSDNDTREATYNSAIDDKFDTDVKLLLESMGRDALTEGMRISITLQEILKVVPRKRPRVDSYEPLVCYLKDQLGVELIITSKKSKNNEKENL